jgi:hypothetical protein
MMLNESNLWKFFFKISPTLKVSSVIFMSFDDQSQICIRKFLEQLISQFQFEAIKLKVVKARKSAREQRIFFSVQ